MPYSVACKTRNATALLLSTMLSSGFANSAVAQTFAQVTTPPRQVVDERGVDVISGAATIAADPTQIGSLGFADSWTGQTNYDGFQGYIAANGNDRTVFVAGKSIRFILSGGVYVSVNADGSTLTKVNTPEQYTYTASDGAVYHFARMLGSAPNRPVWNVIRAHLQTITHPNGRKQTYNYGLVDGAQVCGHTCYYPAYFRVQSVTSNDGYMLKADYASAAAGSSYNKLTSVKAIDLSVDYCDPFADSCTSLVQSWPTKTVTGSTVGSVVTRTLTDEAGNATDVDLVSSRVTDIDRPATPGNEATITYDGSGKVATFAEDGASYGYTYSTTATTQTTTVTAPDGSTDKYFTDTTSLRLVSEEDSAGATTSYQYDASGRQTRKTEPEGNYAHTTYDLRGNITEVRSVAKPGSGLADITATASYDASCAITAKCNKPNYTIDPAGSRTDLYYDANHGELTKIAAAKDYFSNIRAAAPGHGSDHG